MALPPFQRFLEENAAAVRRLCVAALGPVDADDAFQETFLSALRAYPDLDGNANPRAWVLTIAHRKAIDHHRARARRPVPAGDTLPDIAAPTQRTAVEDDTALWGKVRALAPKQRAAVLLRIAGDLTHAEIAVALDCSEAAARRSYHDGLAALRARATPASTPKEDA